MLDKRPLEGLRRLLLHRGLFHLAVVLGSVCFCQAQLLGTTVISGKQAHILHLPMAIADKVIGSFSWSPNGDFLLFARQEPSADTALAAIQVPPAPAVRAVTLWDNARAKSRPLYRLPLSTHISIGFTWLPNSSVGLVKVSWQDANGGRTHKLLRFNAAGGSVEEILSFFVPGGGGYLSVWPSPSKPAAALSYSELDGAGNEIGSLVTAVRTSGAIAEPTSIVRGNEPVLWDKPGNAVFPVSVWNQTLEVPEPQWASLSLESGRTEFLKSQPSTFARIEPVEKLRVLTTSSAIGDASHQVPCMSAWLTATEPSPFPSALICGEVEAAQLGPGAKTIAYTSKGVLCLVKIETVDRAAVEESLLASEQNRILSQARQIGAAAMRVAGENKDTLPTDAEGMLYQLAVVMGPGTMLNGFVYTFGGGSVVTAPSGSAIGYIPGTSGKAVIGIDGKVTWIVGK